MENDELRAVVREAVRAEIAPLEIRVAGVERQTMQNTQMIAQQAQALMTVANATAEASALGAKAMRESIDGKDAAAKMVESALTIHKKGVTDEVRASMSEALRPLAEEVAKIKATSSATKTETSAQSTELTTQTSMLDELKKSKRADRLLIILAGLSSLVTWLISTHH